MARTSSGVRCTEVDAERHGLMLGHVVTTGDLSKCSPWPGLIRPQIDDGHPPRGLPSGRSPPSSVDDDGPCHEGMDAAVIPVSAPFREREFEGGAWLDGAGVEETRCPGVGNRVMVRHRYGCADRDDQRRRDEGEITDRQNCRFRHSRSRSSGRCRGGSRCPRGCHWRRGWLRRGRGGRS
jgi:hypothetical protein